MFEKYESGYDSSFEDEPDNSYENEENANIDVHAFKRWYRISKNTRFWHTTKYMVEHPSIGGTVEKDHANLD